MLPARADPGYSTWSAPASPDPTVDEEDIIHSVVARGHQRSSEAIDETHLVDEEDIHSVVAARHQHIRALPMLPGTALIGSHRLIHWSSMHANSPMYANGSATEWERPRRMLAFGLADARFEPPLLHADLIRQRAGLRGWRPPLGARLALVAHVLVRSHFEGVACCPSGHGPCCSRCGYCVSMRAALLTKHSHGNRVGLTKLEGGLTMPSHGTRMGMAPGYS